LKLSTQQIIRLSFFCFAKENSKRDLVIAVDFDKTINKYKDGWQGKGIYDEPFEDTALYLNKLKELGCTIIINTCRNEQEEIKKYLNQNKIPFDYINKNINKNPNTSNKIDADAYVDDKAIRFNGNWEKTFEDLLYYVIQPSKKIIKKQSNTFNIFNKSSMTLKNILDMTSENSIKNYVNCNAKLKKADPANYRWTFSVKSKGSDKTRTVRFKLIKEHGTNPMNRTILVSCDCPSWRYNGADYNAKSLSYRERQMSNNSSPDVRDPERKFLVCKHIKAVAEKFKSYIVVQKHKQLY
jgi:hypothetical protein